MNTTVYSRIYAGLLEIIPDLPMVKQGDYCCSNVSGSMALGLDVLYSSKTEIHLELTHHFEQNGVLVPALDMEICVYLVSGEAEALMFQNQSGFRYVYGEGEVDVHAQKSLNEFLHSWLVSLKQRGHCLINIERSAA